MPKAEVTNAAAPRLVLLSVSAGAGHVRAAAALCAQAQASGMAVTHIDVMSGVPSWFRWVYAELYAILVNHAPQLWRWLYSRMNQRGSASLLQTLRCAIEQRASAAWLAQVAAIAPDVIVCTHFMPAEVLGKLQAGAGGAVRFNCPVYVHVTDFDLHAMWVQPGVAGYFVACDELRFHLQRAGVAAACVAVTGIALTAQFAPMPRQDTLLREHGFNPRRPTVLLMGGGGGFGGLDRIAAQLLESAGDFQLLVMAGSNATALAALRLLADKWPGRLAAMGHTDQVAQLMASVDVVITKPGGLTSSECLAIGVAMIVNAPIPGQEERNADHLLEQGAALKAVDGVTLAYRLRYLLDHPAERDAMARRGRSLGRPDAARHIIDHIIDRIGPAMKISP